MILGPVNFQDMRPARPLPVAAPPAEEKPGMAIEGRTLVDRGLVESVLWRPYTHHQAENLFNATQDMVGTQYDVKRSVPDHIARRLQGINEIN